MARVPTSFVQPRHAYTGAKVPWQTDPDRAVVVSTKDGHRFGWRLFRYLSGGGMAALGRPSSQELAIRRQDAFLCVAAGLAVLWLVFLLLPTP